MSLCLILQNEKTIAISGDTRGCIKENGIPYHYGDEFKKIYLIDNKKVIFISGDWVIMEKVIKEFEKSHDKSMDNLKNIAMRFEKEFRDKYPYEIKEGQRLVELIVACFENGKSVIYNISSHDNYNILRVEGDKHTNVIGLGSHCDEAMKLANMHMHMHMSKMNTIRMYEYIHDSLSSEQMGGRLTLYLLKPTGVAYTHQYQIKDSRPLIKYNDIAKKKVHADPNVGIKIQKNTTGGTFEPVWKDTFYVDEEGTLITEEMIAKKLQITDGTDDGILIDAKTRKIDFSKFDTVAGKLTAKNLILNGMNVEDEIGNINMSISKNGQLEVKATNSQKLIDRDGINPRAIKEEPNKCWNSGMENFSATGKPDYWSGGISSNEASFEGTYSMRLVPNEFSQQIIEGGEGLASADWWTGYDTRISLRYKYGGIKIWVYRYSDHQPLSLVDDLNANITYDENGNEIITGVRTGIYLDYGSVQQWRDGYVSFKALTPPGTGQFYIKIQNIDTVDTYIDAVQIESNYKNKSSIYSPGMRSMSTTEFSISECQEFITTDYASTGIQVDLKNRYIDCTVNGMPWTTSDIPSELNGQPVFFHGKFEKENIDGTDYYSKLILTTIGSNIPSNLTNGKIHVAIIGYGIKRK